MPAWKSQLKLLLPRFLVRALQASTKFHYFEGWPNYPLILLFFLRNYAIAMRDRARYRASKTAILEYRQTLSAIRDSEAGKSRKILHLIYGLKKPEPLYHFHWLLIERMVTTTAADKVYFHYTHEPQGAYWEKVKSLVEVVRVPDFDYFGFTRLSHFAHKADVVRLLALYHIGGLYLDIDTLALSSFEQLFSSSKVVLGLQSETGKSEPYGLCNAAIMAPKGHTAVHAWLKSYRYFRSNGKDKYWDEHSVTMPLKLLGPRTDVRVLEPHMFFEINWNEASQFFDAAREKEVRERLAGAYSQHLWESCIMDKLMAEYKSEVPDDRSYLAQELRKTESNILR